MINNDNSLYAEFIQALANRNRMKLPPVIEQQLEFEEYTIKKEHDSAPKDKKKKKVHLTDQYIAAFHKLNKQEQIELYKTRIKVIMSIFDNNFPKVPQFPDKYIDIRVRGSTLRSWKQKQILVSGKQVSIFLRVGDRSRIHNLRNYIYRKSKNTDFETFVLQAINTIPKNKYETIHIGFNDTNQFNIVFQQVKTAVEYGIALNYAQQMGYLNKDQQVVLPQQVQSDLSSPQKSPVKQPNIPKDPKQQSSIITKIMSQSIELKSLEQINMVDKTQKVAIIQQLLPGYNINGLFSNDQMNILQTTPTFKLLQDKNNKKHFKLQVSVSQQIIKSFCCLVNIQDMKRVNSQIQEINVKNIIRSENTAVIYLKLKNYSAIYRGRDFLFLRHVFKSGNNYYIVDKSIENIDYPPFITIVRGSLTSVWCLTLDETTKKGLLFVDITIDNEGILNEDQNTNLSKRYLSKFNNLESFVKQKSAKGEEFESKFFDLEWTIKSSEQNNLDQKVKAFESIDPKNFQQSTSPQSIQQKTSEQKGELDLIQVKDWKSWIPKLNTQGSSIINWNCLNTIYKLNPWEDTQRIDNDWKQHHIWKGQWKRDDKDGGLWYVDQVKMNAQKKVLGYIVKKMGSNLLQGKGILNISLPVDIFSTESNLERLARTFVYAPLVLQPASKMSDPIQQLKEVIKVSFTHSILYGGMQKPFNPVLGETFQGSINGCPIYVEQVSHHPPIAAFYFVGRGYKIFGCIESKMNLGVNTGTGRNDGDIVVQFDNGNIVKFRTPSGQISGLTIGDRKLNLIGKTHYWSPNNDIILQLQYNPDKKGLISFGKQKTPSDHFQGTIRKVKHQFMQKFQKQKTNKPSVSQKDTLKQFSHIQGTWTNQIIIDGKLFFNVNQQKYLQFDYQPNQLPSDANYRSDIIYRRLNNIPRSQNQKQRIEVIQRQDRKLRQKHSKTKH